MDYDQLMKNAALRDVVQRVREVGLHKVAAKLYNVPEFNVKVAAELLGRQLVTSHLRHAKIASGIKALNQLDIKVAAPRMPAMPPPIPAAAKRVAAPKPAGASLFAPPAGQSPFSGNIDVPYTPKDWSHIKPIISNEQAIKYLSGK